MPRVWYASGVGFAGIGRGLFIGFGRIDLRLGLFGDHGFGGPHLRQRGFGAVGGLFGALRPQR